MGWHINLVKNTVKIDSPIALALYQCGADVCDAWKEECSFPETPMLEGIINGGKLVFNPDHMEHMDYLDDEKVQEVLKRFRVKGDVCFASYDGDNRGQKWGYRFDGEGGMVLLKVKSNTWVEVGPKGKPLPKKSKPSARLKKAERDQFRGVRNVIENEGFDYAFRYKSSFEEVKDPVFHSLREAYRAVAAALEAHIESKTSVTH